MYHRDFIIRMIQQFFVFLARLAGLKKDNDPAVILLKLEGAYQQFLGLSRELVHSLPVNGLVELLGASGEVDYNRIVVAAILLREEGMALRSEQEAEGERLLQRSEELLSRVVGYESKLYPELQEWWKKNRSIDAV